MRFVSQLYEGDDLICKNEYIGYLDWHLKCENGNWVDENNIEILNVYFDDATPFIYETENEITKKKKTLYIKKNHIAHFEGLFTDDEGKEILKQRRRYDLYNLQCWTEKSKIYNIPLSEKSSKIKTLYSRDNLLFVFYENGDYDFYIPVKTYLYWQIGKIETYNDYYIPDLFMEMVMKRQREIIIPEFEDCKTINIKFSDGIEKFSTFYLHALGSNYIDNLLENLDEDEVFTALEDFNKHELLRMCLNVWRANEAKIVSFLHKIGSIYYEIRARHLYKSLKGYIDNCHISQFLLSYL